MVLERPSAKQPAASRPTAARRPQRPRSCLGSRFEIFSMKPAHLNNGWRTTAVDVQRPQVRTAPLLPPLHLSPSLPCPDRLPTLLQPRPIEWAQAPTRWIGRLEEELGQLGDASGQVGEALQVGEQQVAPGASVVLLGRGGASGAAAVPGPARTCGCVGRFVWFVLSYHIIT